MMRSLSVRPVIGVLAVAASVPFALAQTPGEKPAAGATDTLFLQTKVGSFKMLPGASDSTRGTLSISFEGTVMVSGLDGTAVPGPGVRLELERKDHNRKVFFGKGTLKVSGNFRAIQFFGRNLNGSFTGACIARLYGEFDRNMETGSFWYASDPKKQDWGTYGRTQYVPPLKSQQSVKGKVRDIPKGQ